jgi:hypothetical protein
MGYLSMLSLQSPRPEANLTNSSKTFPFPRFESPSPYQTMTCIQSHSRTTWDGRGAQHDIMTVREEVPPTGIHSATTQIVTCMPQEHLFIFPIEHATVFLDPSCRVILQLFTKPHKLSQLVLFCMPSSAVVPQL